MKDILAIIGTYVVCRWVWRGYNTHVKGPMVAHIEEYLRTADTNQA